MIRELLQKEGKKLAVLIDPEKVEDESLISLIEHADTGAVDFFLVGGSILTRSIDNTIITIKKHTQKPIVLFPGNACQVTQCADALLYLSLISGRNSEFLIGNHVISAPLIKRYSLPTIPTGYMLIDCGNATSVEYMSGTKPIPYTKNDIAVATALAGEMLGLQAIYLEGGSGAKTHVSASMISDVKQNITIPLIVGGGIRTKEAMDEVYKAGADVVVVGTALEENPQLLVDFLEVKNKYV